MAYREYDLNLKKWVEKEGTLQKESPFKNPNKQVLPSDKNYYKGNVKMILEMIYEEERHQERYNFDLLLHGEPKCVRCGEKFNKNFEGRLDAKEILCVEIHHKKEILLPVCSWCKRGDNGFHVKLFALIDEHIQEYIAEKLPDLISIEDYNFPLHSFTWESTGTNSEGDVYVFEYIENENLDTYKRVAFIMHDGNKEKYTLRYMKDEYGSEICSEEIEKSDPFYQKAYDFCTLKLKGEIAAYKRNIAERYEFGSKFEA